MPTPEDAGKELSVGKEDHLTVRQERFVHEYLVDGNGSAAAIRAGYTPNRAEATASRLLTNGKVSRRLEILKAAQLERVDFDADTVLRELATLSTVTIAEFIDDEGYLRTDLKNISKEALACVAEVMQETVTRPDGSSQTRVKLRLHDRIKALNLVGKHRSVQAFVERVEFSSSLSDRMAELGQEQLDDGSGYA